MRKLFYLSLLLLSFQSIGQSVSLVETNEVKVTCSYYCTKAQAIDELLNQNNNTFQRKNTVVLVYYYDELIHRFNIDEILVLTEVGENIVSPEQALECSEDPDHDCNDWYNQPVTGDYAVWASKVVSNSRFEITISQEYINDTNSFISALITGFSSIIPATIATRITANLGAGAITYYFADALSGTVYSYVIGNINWTRLKAGDTLLIEGGKLKKVVLGEQSDNDNGGHYTHPDYNIREFLVRKCVTGSTGINDSVEPLNSNKDTSNIPNAVYRYCFYGPW